MPSPAWKSIISEFLPLKRINSKRVNSSDYWYRSKVTGEEYYLHIDSHSPPLELIYDSLKSKLLSTTKTNAIHIFSDKRLEECAWRPYMEPPFHADDFDKLDQTTLILSKNIQLGVDLVQIPGDTAFYIHKYMTPYSNPTSFSIEVNNHVKIGESLYVPRLVAITTKNNENRGLLLTVIDGDDLSKLTLTLSDKWNVTDSLLHALLHLESRSYFPQDLKPANIILRRADMSVVIIDLGDGYTEGYYRDCSSSGLVKGHETPPAGVFQASDSFYTLGRTLWAIWSDDPLCFDHPEPPNTIPQLIRHMIHDCCDAERFTTIAQLYNEFSGKIKNQGNSADDLAGMTTSSLHSSLRFSPGKTSILTGGLRP